MIMPFFSIPKDNLVRVLVSVLILRSATVSAEWTILYGHSEPTKNVLQLPQNQECPVFVDDLTSTSFPWTWEPTCIEIVLPSFNASPKTTELRASKKGEKKETFCVYTSTHFANGRGISMVTTPAVATSYVLESFSRDFQDDAALRNGGQMAYETKGTAGKGTGLFATRIIKAGDEIMEKHPTLLIHRALIAEGLLKERVGLLRIAIRQLPEETAKRFRALAKSRGGDEIDDIVATNGMGIRLGEGQGWEKKGTKGVVASGERHLGVVSEAAVSTLIPSSLFLLHLHRCRTLSMEAY